MSKNDWRVVVAAALLVASSLLAWAISSGAFDRPTPNASGGWIYEWQTLIGGVFALAAAWSAWLAVRDSIGAQERLARRRSDEAFDVVRGSLSEACRAINAFWMRVDESVSNPFALDFQTFDELRTLLQNGIQLGYLETISFEDLDPRARVLFRSIRDDIVILLRQLAGIMDDSTKRPFTFRAQSALSGFARAVAAIDPEFAEGFKGRVRSETGEGMFLPERILSWRRK